jgi:quinol-cytochrome oxidoreductase complex cytochrome b subunit
MKEENEKEILNNHYHKLYKEYRNNEILKYANIKLIVAVIVISYFGTLDIYIQQNTDVCIFRFIALFSIALFFVLKYTVFKIKTKQVNFFYTVFWSPCR